MTATSSSTSPRRGFTLVELLVAMALIIFIMVILTEAFTAGTGVFRTLKAQGDMQEKLRATVGLIRDDLRQTPGKQVHFGSQDPFLLSTLGINGNLSTPGSGYFYIQQPAQQFLPPAMQFGSMPEGLAMINGPQSLESLDTFSIRMNSPLYQLNGANQAVVAGTPPAAFLPAMCFTLNKTGTGPQDYFAARIPGQGGIPALPALSATEQLFFIQKPGDYQVPVPLMGTTPTGLTQLTPPMQSNMRTSPTTQSGLLFSQWAEVGYFLVPTGLTAGTTTPMPTYSLRRRLRVVLPNQTITTLSLNAGANRIPAALWGPRYAEVSCYPDSVNPNFLFFNTPTDVANPPQPTVGGALPLTNVSQKVGGPPAGCQVLVPPLSPVVQPPQQTPLPQPQQAQQSLLPLATGTVVVQGTPQQQGQNDWAGDDIILTDLISFNVRVLALSRANVQNPTVPSPYSSDFVDLTDPVLGLNKQGLPCPGFYNTGDNPPVTIAALEITIRIWDTKTSQTRQVTFIQDM